MSSTIANPAKTAEPIEVAFELWTGVVTRSRLLNGEPDGSSSGTASRDNNDASSVPIQLTQCWFPRRHGSWDYNDASSLPILLLFTLSVFFSFFGCWFRAVD